MNTTTTRRAVLSGIPAIAIATITTVDTVVAGPASGDARLLAINLDHKRLHDDERAIATMPVAAKPGGLFDDRMTGICDRREATEWEAAETEATTRAGVRAKAEMLSRYIRDEGDDTFCVHSTVALIESFVEDVLRLT